MADANRTDADWGDPSPGYADRAIASGGWSMTATDHGLESIRYAGVRVATRLFFSVRDLLWGSPRVTFDYSGDFSDGGTLAIRGTVDGAPLEVVGTAEASADTLRFTFRVTAADDVEVSRAGPCILHERADLAPGFVAGGPTGREHVALADRIVIARVATGFDELDLSIDGYGVVVGFEGELFEMEDQRNWADSTFKSYCPPLSDPQPISLRPGESLGYAISFAATPPAVRSATVRSATVAPGDGPLTLRDGSESHAMPGLGLQHSGGRLSEDAAARLRTIRPAYLHLLADLDSPTWHADLEADLGAAEQLATDAIISVDAGTDGSALAELAGLARGRVSTVLLFDRGGSTTSDALAAHTEFDGAGIRLGGGSRSNFASLNTAGRVPDRLEVVAVPLAVASHDDDRRALTTSIDSFEAIIRDTRRIAGGRELLVGPVGFRPTYDSWGPAGRIHDPRVDWMSTSPRDGTEFAAAWLVAAVGALAACNVPRVTIGTTGGVLESPSFGALEALGALRGATVWRVGAGPRVHGIRSESELVLGVMADNETTIDIDGRQFALTSPGVFQRSVD